MTDLRGSLRTRIVLAFTAMSLVLSTAWGLGAVSALRIAEDRVLERQLELIAEDYARRVEIGGGTHQSDSAQDSPYMEYNDVSLPFVTSYREPDELPSDLVPWASASPAVGLYEFTEEEFHVAVLDVDVPNSARFLVFDVSGIEAPSSEDALWYVGLAALALLIGLGATVIGFLIGQFSVKPMVLLARIVAEINPEHIDESDRKRIKAHRFGLNEAGLLANAIERMVTRICAFIERERSFTAAVSHELRTPTTVIGGALELLEREKLSERARRVLERIRDANTNTQSTIRMFLALARESNSRLMDDEEFRVLAVVEKTIDDYETLLMRANGRLINIQADADPVLKGHVLAFATVVGNLLRNAVEHGIRRDECTIIEIRVGLCDLVVYNRSERVPSSTSQTSPVTGLGLEIVHRLCESNGWSFDLTESDGEATARFSWV
ncbi:MAG: HAMP domain-containing sensor histidine kinase [Gammaproteobacteria bacterium]|nr:HAMP domain-containing sensor histidine kinase [Gammaproteobacteria bacterium]